MGSERRPHSLEGRVAWSTGMAAVGGATLVACLGLAFSWTLALRQEDRRLIEALGALSFELEHTDASVSELERVLDEERAEVRPTGIELSLVRRDELTLHDAHDTAPPVAAGCRTHGTSRGGEALRQCTVLHGTAFLVAESSLAPSERGLVQTGAAMGLALLLVAGASLALSRRAARLAIEPIQSLRLAVSRIDPAHPSPDAMPDAIDCLEVEQLRREFEVLLVHLAQSLDQARQFAFHAAHEWRTPLTALRAEVELLREDSHASLTTGSGDVDALRRIETHLHELQDRLDRVLVLATPPVKLHGEPVSLESIAQELVAGLGAERERVTVQGEEGLILGDASLLKMSMRNAVENALKFSSGHVRVRVTEAERVVTVLIDDEGPGVPLTERERVFVPFFRGHDAVRSHVQGTGLGLALVAHIARMHQGHASFDPVARGARLRLAFPCWDSVEDGRV